MSRVRRWNVVAGSSPATRNGRQTKPVDLEVLIENVLNALTAGVTIGCIYGLMCIGLGLIFGIMRIVNFAQGELLMLGMFASLYLVTGGGVLAFLGPYIGPFVGALLRRADRVRRRRAAAQVPDLPGSPACAPPASLDDGHFGQLIVTLGISLILQNGGLIVFGSTPETVRTPLSPPAPSARPDLRRRHGLPEQGAPDRLCGRDRHRGRAVSGHGVHPPRQGAARRGRQPDGRDLHGHRRRPRLSHRLRHWAAASPRSPAD